MRNHSGLLLFLAIPALLGPARMAAGADGSRAVRLRLTLPTQDVSAALSNGPVLMAPSAGDARPVSVDVLGETRVAGQPPRQRNPQLSRDHLVIIGVDADGVEIARVTTPDPTLVRAETVDEEGRISSRRLFRDSVDFSVVLPDDPKIVKLEIRRPRWTGSEFVLDLVGTDALRRRGE